MSADNLDRESLHTVADRVAVWFCVDPESIPVEPPHQPKGRTMQPGRICLTTEQVSMLLDYAGAS